MLAIDDVRIMTIAPIFSSRRATSIAEVLALLRERGARQYEGEPVSHRVHVLQCATLAHASGAAPPLIAACLLHDIGHLLTDTRWDRVTDGDPPATPTLAGLDDRHEVTGAAWLGALFLPPVVQPIRWHVAAKRYLAATEAGYLTTLSEDSRRSLVLQGGVMSTDEAAAFAARPWAADSVRLRRWDEASKRPGAHAMPMERLARILEACQRG